MGQESDWANSDEVDSDMEDSMFEMDDILSTQVSHASSSLASSFKSDYSPRQDLPGGGGGGFPSDQGQAQAHSREAMKLKTFSTFKALQGAVDDGSGSSTPR